LDGNGLNWRGVAVFGLAVLTVIVLIAVIDDEPAPLGVNTAGTSQDGSETTSTTVPGETTTTGTGGGGSTTTTKPGATTTTAFNPAGKPQLQQGSTGTDVVFLQEQLKRLNFYTGAADGSFGAATRAAVVAFQTAKGVTPADGVVGPATWTALSTA
jgi:peptidoglycan hydrolase-like protein with peptidoglycan-binding domain